MEYKIIIFNNSSILKGLQTMHKSNLYLFSPEKIVEMYIYFLKLPFYVKTIKYTYHHCISSSRKEMQMETINIQGKEKEEDSVPNKQPPFFFTYHFLFYMSTLDFSNFIFRIFYFLVYNFLTTYIFAKKIASCFNHCQM